MGNQQEKAKRQINSPPVSLKKSTEQKTKQFNNILSSSQQKTQQNELLSTTTVWTNQLLEYIKKISPWIQSCKQQFNNNQYIKDLREFRYSFHYNIRNPFQKIYQVTPEKITQIKFKIISPFTYHQRFIFLNLLCALAAVKTFKSATSAQLSFKLLHTIKIVGVVYIVGGLFIAPEVYNPFIKSDQK